MPETYDYPESVPVSNDSLAKISRLAVELRLAKAQVEDAENALKLAKDQMVQIAEYDLPEAMAAVGMGEVRLSDGTRVSVSDNIFARITDANQQAAFEWLNEHGHGNLIKREFKIGFGRDQEQWAADFETVLGTQGVSYDRKQTVHPSTLKSFVKGQLEDGVEIPEDVFGVHRKSVAKLS
jgi:hypothetical protein